MEIFKNKDHQIKFPQLLNNNKLIKLIVNKHKNKIAYNQNKIKIVNPLFTKDQIKKKKKKTMEIIKKSLLKRVFNQENLKVKLNPQICLNKKLKYNNNNKLNNHL